MINIFPLPIFPQGVLSGSVITTVWVGIAVVCFFNLRLGWVLSGLVIPGYLAPLLMVKPISVLVILVEGIFTHFLVSVFSEYQFRGNRWSNLFGRDRFFGILLCSIMVRVVMDGWLLPLLGSYLNTRFNLVFDYQNNLHSFGLIIVALIANFFWKPGFLRGLFQLLVMIGITFLIIRYVLVEVTNFNISNLNYMYEDIAISMLASPKTYIILVTAAYIASRMNLLYGWEFNGILIPALLTLQWYQPLKIVDSFVEAYIILAIANLLLRLPIFTHMSVEGARKLLLFFNIGFVYKIILGYLIIYFAPHVKATDYFAFGYVLSSLIAIKMYDKNMMGRLTFSTIQTSIVAIVVASIIGYSLTRLPQVFFFPKSLYESREKNQAYANDNKLIDVLRQDKVALYKNTYRSGFSPPNPSEINLFSEAVSILKTLTSVDDSPELTQTKQLLSRINYGVHVIESRYFYLKEKEPTNGWGFYVIDSQPQTNLLIEVPDAFSERGSVDVGTMLYVALNGRFLAVAGTSRNTSQDVNANVLRGDRTLYQAFHRAFAHKNVLQVRIFTSELERKTAGVRRKSEQIFTEEIASKLWVKASLPTGINLNVLKKALNTIDIKWAISPSENLQRDTTSGGFAELVLNRTDVRHLLSSMMVLKQDVSLLKRNENIVGYLQEWVASTKSDFLAPSGTNLYRAPKMEDLLFFEQQVLLPMLAQLKQYRNGQWSQAGLDELGLININAAQAGYRIIRYHHQSTGEDYLILSEISDEKVRTYRGIYIFRLGDSRPFIIQIPRPIFEVNSFEYGLSLFESLHARAVFIAGAHPNANLDKSADILSQTNRINLFNLVSQVTIRESGDEPLMIVQSRSFGVRPDIPSPDADVLLAFNTGAIEERQLSGDGQLLVKKLQELGMKIKFVSGEPETAGYEVGNLYQAKYLEQSKNKEFAIIWLSPLSRLSFRQQTENKLQALQFVSVQIPTIQEGLYDYIRSQSLGFTSSVPADMKGQLAHYLDEQDVVILQNIRTEWPAYKLERLIDKNTGQAFLVVYGPDNKLLLVINLGALDLNKTIHLSPGSFNQDDVNKFTESHAGWLELDKAL